MQQALGSCCARAVTTEVVLQFQTLVCHYCSELAIRLAQVLTRRARAFIDTDCFLGPERLPGKAVLVTASGKARAILLIIARIDRST